ncbi:hydroxyectoine utilization dehydratase EutB [Tepidamorphus sp. 3E244]|uniref:hydroxyectoine utilization dehydratase EutB n=1 Tax=Tepidamorphus sp. 3E244 TaxID=3385498 RepID=UPI0038FCC8CB
MMLEADAITRAASRIRGHVTRTPLVAATDLSREAGREVRLKVETLQRTGSFKLRGAMNAVLSLSGEDRARGVITVSSGNHGPALAAAAQAVGARCTVCLSEMAPKNKVENVHRFGGKTHVAGRDFDWAAKEAVRLADETGAVMIPPFDHPDVLAGAGTIGAEIMEDWAEVDTVIAPLSGGGLLGGVAIAVKAAKPNARVIGVSMERGASMYESLKAGKPVDVPEEDSLADALGGSIGLDNNWTFEPVRDLVDDAILVPEGSIAQAMRRLFTDQGLAVEGAGAVGVAALLEGHLPKGAKNVAIVISGRNVSREQLLGVLNDERV